MYVRKLIKQLKHSFLHLVFPSYCLHCEELTSHDQSFLCSSCLTLLELIDPDQRCSACFGQKDPSLGRRCTDCLKEYSIFKGVGAAFDYIGPAASLIKKLKYANQPYLAEGAGAFLVAQWDRLNWPVPDVIIPVPLSFTHWVNRGYNQSALLAEHMSLLLNVPVWDALYRKSGDFSQAALSLSQRKSLGSDRFLLKKNYCLEDKVILLLDDVMTSGSTLKRCAEVLAEGYPTSLYALVFSRAL